MGGIPENSLVPYIPSQMDVRIVASPSLPDRVSPSPLDRDPQMAGSSAGHAFFSSGHPSAEVDMPGVYTVERRLSAIDTSRIGTLIDTYA